MCPDVFTAIFILIFFTTKTLRTRRKNKEKAGQLSILLSFLYYLSLRVLRGKISFAGLEILGLKLKIICDNIIHCA